MSSQGKSRETPIPITQTPWLLIILALFFVPGVYIVLIVAIAMTIGIGVGLIFGLWYVVDKWLPFIPVGIFIALGIGILIGIFAGFYGIFRSFWREPRFEPAIMIDLSKEPSLTSFMRTVCDLVGTAMPDSVILHAGSSFFVSHDKLDVLNGRVKGRILSISLPLLNSLTVNELRAVLSHEFAHFTGRDTLYSSFVLPVYIGTTTASEVMDPFIDSGDKNGNPGCVAMPLFLPTILLKLYLTIFHYLDMKISRSRERRADIIATSTCGSNSFANGLRKVAALGEAFQNMSRTHIIEALKEGNAFVNYYEVFRGILPELKDSISNYEIKRDALSLMKDILEDTYGSHPSLLSRLRYIPKVDEQHENTGLALTLITHLEEYETVLTAGYTELLATQVRANIIKTESSEESQTLSREEREKKLAKIREQLERDIEERKKQKEL